MSRVNLTGYTDRISVRPGQDITFYVNAEGTTSADVEIVRLIHGDENPEGPGFLEEVITTPLSGAHEVRKQFVDIGNAVVVDDPTGKLDLTGDLTISAWVFSTTPEKGRQVIMGRYAMDTHTGYALGIDAYGHLSFWIGNGHDTDEITAEVPLLHHTWYFVSVRVSGKHATLSQRAYVNPYNSRLGPVAPIDYTATVRQELKLSRASAATPFMWAAARNSAPLRGAFKDLLFNGKIDRSAVWNRALDDGELQEAFDGTWPTAGLVANWDTTAGYGDHGIDDVVRDVSVNALHGIGVQRPVRAITGYNWSGRHDDWRIAPGEYGGIAFHDDAVVDCEWDATFTWTVPAGQRSGAYAARLRSGDVEDHIVFFVRPDRAQAKILYLMPTNSYLAYANEMIVHHIPVAQAILSHSAVLTEKEAAFYQDPKYGRSTYDHWNDGEGVCFSSWRRPILNMRPKWRASAIGTTWQFPRDLSVIAWLEAKGYEYDVACDHDLADDGQALLDQYAVVLTGSHPEYWSESNLDAMEGYIAGGGRLMYLGGNGFYWVVSYRDGEPHIMEVRKGEAGMRAWQAMPGEYYHQTSAERGGLWRTRGRAPQKMTGVGFTTQGFDECHPYKRMPDSYHKSVSWIFNGAEEEVFGDYGLALGGAAGLETERYDLALGTPPHTMLLASASGFSDNYPGVTEDILYNHSGLMGTQNPAVRADMTYFTTAKNGAVFATGSIAWMSALPCFGFNNGVSTITANVLDAFVKQGSLPGGAWVEEEKSWR